MKLTRQEYIAFLTQLESTFGRQDVSHAIAKFEKEISGTELDSLIDDILSDDSIKCLSNGQYTANQKSEQKVQESKIDYSQKPFSPLDPSSATPEQIMDRNREHQKNKYGDVLNEFERNRLNQQTKIKSNIANPWARSEALANQRNDKLTYFSEMEKNAATPTEKAYASRGKKEMKLRNDRDRDYWRNIGYLAVGSKNESTACLDSARDTNQSLVELKDRDRDFIEGSKYIAQLKNDPAQAAFVKNYQRQQMLNEYHKSQNQNDEQGQKKEEISSAYNYVPKSPYEQAMEEQDGRSQDNSSSQAQKKQEQQLSPQQSAEPQSLKNNQDIEQNKQQQMLNEHSKDQNQNDEQKKEEISSDYNYVPKSPYEQMVEEQEGRGQDKSSDQSQEKQQDQQLPSQKLNEPSSQDVEQNQQQQMLNEHSKSQSQNDEQDQKKQQDGQQNLSNEQDQKKDEISSDYNHVPQSPYEKQQEGQQLPHQQTKEDQQSTEPQLQNTKNAERNEDVDQSVKQEPQKTTMKEGLMAVNERAYSRHLEKMNDRQPESFTQDRLAGQENPWMNAPEKQQEGQQKQQEGQQLPHQQTKEGHQTPSQQSKEGQQSTEPQLQKNSEQNRDEQSTASEPYKTVPQSPYEKIMNRQPESEAKQSTQPEEKTMEQQNKPETAPKKQEKSVNTNDVSKEQDLGMKNEAASERSSSTTFLRDKFKNGNAALPEKGPNKGNEDQEVKAKSMLNELNNKQEMNKNMTPEQQNEKNNQKRAEEEKDKGPKL